MSKLGYTWYSQDYISDPDVMMMTPSQRGIFRDLIDLAYRHDNVIKYSIEQLCRYTNAEPHQVEEILEMMGEDHGEYWSIPSCQKRIDKALINRQNGSKGGRPKNPSKTQSKTQLKPNTKGKEKEKEKEKVKEKENKSRPKNADQVKDYFLQLGLNGISETEAQKFMDHYSSVGWVIGRGHTPMKDWKAAARNWKSRIDPSKLHKPKESKKSGFGMYDG